ncbi:hypothetical protein Q7O_003775 [Pectobacterium carotovorum subsp. carotovorum PCCS1]|nr:hypothetical protein [Pectobacterium carotovorum subsp. carotovorum PCCS1]
MLNVLLLTVVLLAIPEMRYVLIHPGSPHLLFVCSLHLAGGKLVTACKRLG